PAPTPTEPGLRFGGGKGLLAIWSDALLAGCLRHAVWKSKLLASISLLLVSKSDFLASISLLLVSKSDFLASISLLLVSKSVFLVSISLLLVSKSVFLAADQLSLRSPAAPVAGSFLYMPPRATAFTVLLLPPGDSMQEWSHRPRRPSLFLLRELDCLRRLFQELA